MFEFEEISTGFHDGYLSKYADSSGPIYDIFISDSMQDMLDIDIRSEVATVVGGSNEFASLINDLPSLDDIDSASNDGEASWLGGPKWSAAHDFYADVGACVNPNSVMPIISSSLLNSPKISLNTNNLRMSAHSPPISPKESKSHLTFSPNQIKIPTTLQDKRISQLAMQQSRAADSIKKDLVSELKNVEEKPNGHQHKMASSPAGSTITLGSGIGGLTFANTTTVYNSKYKAPQTIASRQVANLSQNASAHVKRESSPTLITNMATLQKVIPRNVIVQNKNISPSISHGVHSPIGSPQSHHGHSTTKAHKMQKQPLVISEFPKPAYSYSCLIAMALKNSRSGSLPVSEIYSFMCEHFPYFKTAPNGWKNSVRHNLSLNKCFEKIEKPATNGGQRKGCLWAMNPAKIVKMDEEVQKWSRKDPMAIRKAMVFPEHLEALERGEMKHGSTGDSDGEGDVHSDVDENSDSEEQDPEIEDHLIETPESFVDEDEDDTQQERDFDIEVQDIYDAIDLEDDKEAVRLAIRQNDLIEMSENGYQSPKRARLNVNYSIAPAGTFEHQFQQQQHQNNFKQQQHRLQLQTQQQQVHLQNHHQQQSSPTPHHNRRKMQLVNRIA